MADPTPLPYGLSWWLDAVTDDDWQGLVVDDYRVVLPLPIKRKFGLLPILTRAYFTQHCGPFGNIESADTGKLLTHLPHTLRLSLPLRPSLIREEVPKGYKLRERTNLILNLNRPYPEIASHFPGKLRAYLRKTAEDKIEVADPEQVITLSRHTLAGKPGVTEATFKSLDRLIKQCRERRCGECYRLREHGELLALGFYPELAGRTINLVAASTERGRKRRGMSRLLARLIEQRAEVAGNILDFEGSDLPGVKQYFEKFGAQPVNYWQLER
jgi:hypothetical protein